MEVNHIIDNKVKETQINVITNEDKVEDYNIIESLILLRGSSFMGKDEDNDKYIKVKDGNIIYFETYKRDICFTTTNNEFLVIKSSMKNLEQIIENRKHFIKISKSVIINILHVEEVNYHSNMRFQIILKNGYKQIVNRSYFKDFKNCIEEVYA